MSTLEELSRSLGLLKARLPIRALRHLTEGHIHNLAKHIGGDTWLRILDRNLNTVDVQNTAAEAPIYSFSIPAGILGATGGVRLSLGGDMLKNAGGTLTLRIKLGATTVFTSTSVELITSAERYKWSWDIWFLNVSASSQKWSAKLLAVAVTDNLAMQGLNTLYGIAAAGQATSSEDTSAAKNLQATIKWSSASTLLSFRKEMALLELLPAA